VNTDTVLLSYLIFREMLSSNSIQAVSEMHSVLPLSRKPELVRRRQ